MFSLHRVCRDSRGIHFQNLSFFCPGLFYLCSMFRLDNILERWAMAYKPLSHQPEASEGKDSRRTFYRIDTINANNEFVQNYNLAPSPCMAYSTLVDGSIVRGKNKMVSYRHSIYFMVKQVPPASGERTMANDALEATEAKYEGDMLVQDLLAFLYALKDCATETVHGTAGEGEDIVRQIISTLPADEIKGVAGLQLDGAEWGTMPVRYNHWWVCGLMIEQYLPRTLCIVDERYNV